MAGKPPYWRDLSREPFNEYGYRGTLIVGYPKPEEQHRGRRRLALEEVVSKGNAFYQARIERERTPSDEALRREYLESQG